MKNELYTNRDRKQRMHIISYFSFWKKLINTKTRKQTNKNPRKPLPLNSKWVCGNTEPRPSNTVRGIFQNIFPTYACYFNYKCQFKHVRPLFTALHKTPCAAVITVNNIYFHVSKLILQTELHNKQAQGYQNRCLQPLSCCSSTVLLLSHHPLKPPFLAIAASWISTLPFCFWTSFSGRSSQTETTALSAKPQKLSTVNTITKVSSLTCILLY